MGKEKNFSPSEDVKVGSSEIFLTPTHIGRFQISITMEIFWPWNLAHIINIKMMLSQNFHGQRSIFQPSGGCQSWKTWNFLPCDCKNTILNGTPLYMESFYSFQLSFATWRLWTNYSSRLLEHLFRKITCRIQFRAQFARKKNSQV